MRVVIDTLLQTALLVLPTIAQQRPTDVCPLLGPAFPAPRKLSVNDDFRTTAASIDDALRGAVASGTLGDYGDAPYNKTAFSVTFFSGSEEGLIHEYHYTPPGIAQSKIGTNKIDADSIYRIASVSKLLSSYLLLIQDGEAHLNTPVATIIPELAKSNRNSSDGILIDWRQVTVADLMTQMSGLGYNYGYDGVPPDYLSSPAFPRIPADQMIPCNYINSNETYDGCTRERQFSSSFQLEPLTKSFTELIQGVLTTPALFQGGYTPVYSNVGFDLFGVALENIAGTFIQNVLTLDLVHPLMLNGTTSHTPNTTKNGVIVPLDGSLSHSEWYRDFRSGNADGGYFSSSNDMAAIGRAILTSSLIPQTITNRWLKPRTFTSSTGTQQAVGGPWEIFKQTASSQEYNYYLYTKQGDLDTYHTMFVLVPDFNFGFTVFTAAETSTTIQISNLIMERLAPVLESIAQDQADSNFAGTYTSEQLNSSLTVETDAHPGIKITEWISNSTDVLKLLADDQGWSLKSFDFRLYPNQVYSGDKVGFSGSMTSLPNAYAPGVFSDPCQTWTGPGGNPYGKADLGSFVFEMDEKGKAKGVESKGLRVKLQRE